MKIACLGWGSLIWRPAKLKIDNQWREDGPFLPIEFTRQSDNGRITLIVDRSANPVRVLWAIMTVETLPLAIESLAEREEIKDTTLIHIANANDNDNDTIKSQIVSWLNSKELDAAIWTGLSYSKKTNNARPEVDYVIAHLAQLKSPVKELAEEYIRRTPIQIDTLYRRRIEQEFGWTPLE